MNINFWQSIRGWVPFLALVAVIPSPGCLRSHTIQGGLWRLKMEPTNVKDDSQLYVQKPRDVEVEVDWGEEENSELIKVSYQIPQGPRTAVRSLTGKIEKGREVHLEGADQDWNLWFKGIVVDPTYMNGNAWARGRLRDDLVFNYLWTMEKIPDEKE